MSILKNARMDLVSGDDATYKPAVAKLSQPNDYRRKSIKKAERVDPDFYPSC